MERRSYGLLSLVMGVSALIVIIACTNQTRFWSVNPDKILATYATVV